MRIRSGLVALAVVAAAICSLEPWTTAANDESTKLIALENAWNQAQMHHDSKALESLVPDTFVYTDYDGTVMNKEQFLADNMDPAYKASLVNNDEVKVFSYKEAAIVIGRYHSKGTYKGKPFDHYGRFTDTWLYENNTWRCVASHTNLIRK